MLKTTKLAYCQLLFLALLFSCFSYAQVGIGTIAPTTMLEVDSGVTDAVFGHSNNVGGYLGRETNITIGVPPQTLLGSGVYANNPTAGYTSLFAQSTGAATVAASINYSDVWIGSYNYVQNASATVSPSAIYGQLNITNSTLPGYKTAFSAYTNRGTITGNPGYTVGATLTADAQNEDAFGLSATVYSNRTGGGGPGAADLAGGEFIVLNYPGSIVRSVAYVAQYLGTTDFKILGSGAVSTIVEDTTNTPRIMFAPEAPEVLFQDFGVGKLDNGIARIDIDPILAKNIFVDNSHPLKVFIQLEGDCKGVFVTDKSTTGFTVKELQNGQSNVSFSWQLVANRKDRSESNLAGASKFQELRFPKYNSPKKLQKIKKEERLSNLSNTSRPKN